jgi:hypothetical protein
LKEGHLIEQWRRWKWRRYEKRASNGDFAKFEKMVSGPWEPEFVRRMPSGVLQQKLSGGIDTHWRSLINAELRRRLDARPTWAVTIAIVSLVVSIISLARTW